MNWAAAIFLALLAAIVTAQETEFRCPMDADVRSASAGACPRCGMKLVRRAVDFGEYLLDMRASGASKLRLELTVRDPKGGRPVRRFQPIHEKLFHLFVVSEDLQFFAHDHPMLDSAGRFRIDLSPPAGGFHRVLADFWPEGGEPQMIVKSLLLPGSGRGPAALPRDDTPKQAENLRIELATVPQNPTPGVKTMLFFRVSPSDGFEPYLGAWGHLFAASDDLIDLIHTHPFAANGTDVQFNVIFPRARTYRIWAQFQRNGVVNTARFDLPVRPLQ